MLYSLLNPVSAVKSGELEEELGIDIFERNGKRLTGLTEPGKEVLHIIERLLLEADNLQRAGLTYSSKSTGTLSIAATHTQTRYVLPGVVQNFAQLFLMCVSLYNRAHLNISLNGSCLARLM